MNEVAETEMARREVSMPRLFAKFAGAWVMIPLGISAFLFLVGGLISIASEPQLTAPIYETREVEDHVPVELTITDKRTMPGLPGEQPVNLVSYTYRGPDGRMIEESEQVPQEVFDDLEIGSELRVMMQTTRTETVPVEAPPAAPETGDGGFGALRVMAAVLALGSAAWLLHAWRLADSAVRAARFGEVREARVTAHETTGTRINGHPMLRLLWQDAASAEGRSRMRREDDLLPVGAVVLVYADPRTGRTWWEADL